MTFFICMTTFLLGAIKLYIVNQMAIDDPFEDGTVLSLLIDDLKRVFKGCLYVHKRYRWFQ